MIAGESVKLLKRDTMIVNAKNAAELLLSQAWPNRYFPVDPYRIATSLGIDVVELDLPEGVSGALIKELGKDPVIVLHSKDSRNRKRFSCAHELGHYIDRQDKNSELYEYVDLRNADSALGTDREEIFANQFAANLLMPEEEVHRLVRGGAPRFIMALRFGVSDDAIQFRLKSLD